MINKGDTVIGYDFVGEWQSGVLGSFVTYTEHGYTVMTRLDNGSEVVFRFNTQVDLDSLNKSTKAMLCYHS